MFVKQNDSTNMPSKHEIIVDIDIAKEILRHSLVEIYDFKDYLIDIEANSNRNFKSLILFCENSLIFQSGQTHLQYRRLIKDFFSVKAIALWEPHLHAAIKNIILKLKDRSSFEFLEAVANPIYIMLMREVFGIQISVAEEHNFLFHVLRTKDVVEHLIPINKIEKIQDSFSYLKEMVANSFISRLYNKETLLGFLKEKMKQIS